MTLTVLTAATVRDLTTLATVKARMGISGSSEDAFLQDQITRQTAAALGYLNVIFAQDGTRTLAREILAETFRSIGPRKYLRTARRPISGITSIVQDDVTLEAADYVVDGRSGVISRLYNGFETLWSAKSVVVTYTAGWVMPGAADPNTPSELEDAVIHMVAAGREARLRDPMIRSERTDGVSSASYFDPRAGSEGLPPSVLGMLAPYMDGPR